MAMRGPDHILGTIFVMAFDALAVSVQQANNKEPTVNEEADQGPAKARATSSTGTLCAERRKRSETRRPPPIPMLRAMAFSASTDSSRFELTTDDPHIRFGMELGAATVTLDASITSAAGVITGPLNASYDLQLDPADHTGQTIKIAVGQPGHTHMKNGGHQCETFPVGSRKTSQRMRQCIFTEARGFRRWRGDNET